MQRDWGGSSAAPSSYSAGVVQHGADGLPDHQPERPPCLPRCQQRAARAERLAADTRDMGSDAHEHGPAVRVAVLPFRGHRLAGASHPPSSAPSCKQRGEAAPSISLLLHQLCMSVPRTKQRCAPQRGLHARPNLTRACRGCICRWPSCEKAPRFPMPPGSVCSDCIDFSSSVGRVCSPPQADGRWVPGAGAVRPPRRQ